MTDAKEFKRWVTHTVLPQIRKTGGYIPARRMTRRPSWPGLCGVVKRMLEEKDQLIGQLQPKAKALKWLITVAPWDLPGS